MKSWRDIAINILSWLADVLDPPGSMSVDEKMALRRELEEKQAANNPPYVWIDRTMIPPAYEPPSPTTDGKVQVQGARYRAVTRQLQEHPGTLMNHERKMREQRARAQRDTEPTKMVPRIRKQALVRQQSYDNYMLPDLEHVTVLRIPTTWML